MLKLIIHDDEGHKTVVPFVREEITIGRQEGNTIRLTERNVSRRHALLRRQNGHVLVEDLGSYNGIRLNGEKIQGQVPVRSGDLIQIGDYDLSIEAEGAAENAPSTAPTREMALDADGIVDATTDAVSASGENALTPLDPATEVSVPVADESPRAARRPPSPPEEGGVKRQTTAVIRREVIEANRPREPKDVEFASAPRLLVLSGPLKGTEFACVRTELRIGRTEDNDIPIDHRSLSRNHAKIVREDNGEWRILDMQSANGLTVNGESYSQVALKFGDVIELGHVKLKFVRPGEARGGGRKFVLLSATVLVLGAIVGGLFVSGILSRSGLNLPSFSTARTPVPEPVVTPEPEAAVPAVPAPEKTLREAEAAVAMKSFTLAVELLEKLAEPRSPAAEKLLAEARIEAGAQEGLAAAEDALSSGSLAEAEKALEALTATRAFVVERDALKAKLEKAQSEQRERAKEESASKAKASAAAQKREEVEVAKAAAPDRAEQLDTFFSEAKEHFLARKYKQSEQVLKRCVAFDDSYAPCHMLLGSTYAKLQQFETGFKHYKRFLELDPDSPQATQVKKLVSDYESSKQQR